MALTAAASEETSTLSGSKVTVARSVAKLTLAPLTPSTLESPFSTRAAHAAHVMPTTGRLMVRACGAAFVAWELMVVSPRPPHGEERRDAVKVYPPGYPMGVSGFILPPGQKACQGEAPVGEKRPEPGGSRLWLSKGAPASVPASEIVLAAAGRHRPFVLGEDLVDDAVRLGLFAVHVEVPVGVAGDGVQVLPGVLREEAVQPVPVPQDLAGVDLDVRGLALDAAPRLVDHDLAVGQGVPTALGARRQEERAHGCGQPHADGPHLGLDQPHGVVDGKACRNASAGAVDVQVDVGVGILSFQKEQLGDDQVRHVVGDGPAQEDDPILEQARVDVVSPLASVGLLDDGGDEHHGGPISLRSRYEGVSRREPPRTEEYAAAKSQTMCLTFPDQTGNAIIRKF